MKVTVSAPAADGRDDTELLTALAGGDRGALRVLHDRHAPWLVLRLGRRCADPDLVDQAVQDTFLAGWRRPDGYRGAGEVGAWIWGIAIRRLIADPRRRRHGHRVLVRPGRPGHDHPRQLAGPPVVAAGPPPGAGPPPRRRAVAGGLGRRRPPCRHAVGPSRSGRAGGRGAGRLRRRGPPPGRRPRGHGRRPVPDGAAGGGHVAAVTLGHELGAAASACRRRLDRPRSRRCARRRSPRTAIG